MYVVYGFMNICKYIKIDGKDFLRFLGQFFFGEKGKWFGDGNWDFSYLTFYFFKGNVMLLIFVKLV